MITPKNLGQLPFMTSPIEYIFIIALSLEKILNYLNFVQTKRVLSRHFRWCIVTLCKKQAQLAQPAYAEYVHQSMY